MSLFPSNPIINQIVTVGTNTSITWQWTGSTWSILPLTLQAGNNISLSANVSNNSLIINGNMTSLDLLQNPQSSAYTLALSDRGKHISITTGDITVPNSIFSAGNTVTIFNNSSASQNIINAGSVTLYLAGSALTGTRTLAQRGLATVLCVAANTFAISGAGLT